MKVITSASSQLIFAWQSEVMFESMLQNGFTEEDLHITVTMVHNGVSKQWTSLQKKYPKATFLFLPANPETKYIGSSKAYGIYKFFETYPEESVHQWFFVDQDVVLSKPLDDYPLGSIHMSPTDYLCVNRMDEKGDDYLKESAALVGISEELVRANDHLCGGAQYIFDNVPPEVWKDSYDYACSLYHHLQKMNTDRGVDDVDGVNSWTAEMWSTLWSFWKYDLDTKIHDSLSFNWPNFGIDQWEVRSIYHDAGNTRKLAEDIGKELFCKYEWIDRLPYGCDIPISEDLCQHNYMQFVQKVGETSCLVEHLDTKVEEYDTSIPKTSEKGFMKMKLPKRILEKIVFNMGKPVIETFDGKELFLDNRTYKLELPEDIKEDIAEELRHYAEMFCGRSLNKTAIYGVRKYTKGSVLKVHKDRQDTHKIGIGILVSKDHDWSFKIQDHDGRWNNVEYNLGDLVVFESAVCSHGRPNPFQGRDYKMLFIHYEYN